MRALAPRSRAAWSRGCAGPAPARPSHRTAGLRAASGNLDAFEDASPAWRNLRDLTPEERALSALRSASLPMSNKRKTVLPAGVDAVPQVCLGLIGSKRPTISTETQGELAAALTQLFRQAAHAGVLPPPPARTKNAAGYERWASQASMPPFTSIQVNFQYASSPHVDANNVGPSYIRGLGDFTGGELVVECGEMPRQRDSSKSAAITTEHDVSNTWHVFDGNARHWTRPFEGERYSIIYFVNSRFGRMSREHFEQLRTLGFGVDGLPPPPLAMADAHKKSEQLAAEGYEVLLVRGAPTFASAEFSRRGEPAEWVDSVRQSIRSAVGTPDVVVEGLLSHDKPSSSVLLAVPPGVTVALDNARVERWKDSPPV